MIILGTNMMYVGSLEMMSAMNLSPQVEPGYVPLSEVQATLPIWREKQTSAIVGHSATSYGTMHIQEHDGIDRAVPRL